MEQTAERLEEQVAQAKSAYEQARQALSDFSRTASEKSKQAMTFTDDWVHENTWLALGLVAGAGLVLGVLMAQCLKER